MAVSKGASQLCVRLHQRLSLCAKAPSALACVPNRQRLPCSHCPAACSKKLEEGGQAVVLEAWLRFEREEGGCVPACGIMTALGASYLPDVPSARACLGACAARCSRDCPEPPVMLQPSHQPACHPVCSADDHFAACLKAEPLLQELQAAASAAAEPQRQAAAKAAAAKAPQLSKEEVRAMRQQADPNYAKRKQQQQQQDDKEKADMPPPPAKRPRTAGPVKAAAPPAAPAAAEAGEGVAPQAAEPEVPRTAGAAAAADAAQAVQADQQQQGEVQEGEAQHAHQQQGQGQQQQALRPGWRQTRRVDANTAFVKHLAEVVDEAAIQGLFVGCPGGVAGIELGRDRQTGRSKVCLLPASRLAGV